MRRWLAVGVLAVAMGALAACGPPALKEGDVVSRRFDGAHTRHWTQQQYVGETCSGSGKTRTCSPNYIYIPQSEYVPDQYYVTITDGKRKSERRVDEQTFHDADPGEHLVLG